MRCRPWNTSPLQFRRCEREILFHSSSAAVHRSRPTLITVVFCEDALARLCLSVTPDNTCSQAAAPTTRRNVKAASVSCYLLACLLLLLLLQLMCLHSKLG